MSRQLPLSVVCRELRECPGNISLWLKLVSIQDGLLQQRTDDDSSKLFTEQTILDKKLAILEQAIKHNPLNLQLKVSRIVLMMSLTFVFVCCFCCTFAPYLTDISSMMLI